MSSRINRRAFLKFSLAASLGLLVEEIAKGMPLEATTTPSTPNIIFLVFDALSARHLSLYGYPRVTSPNMARFAERAMVYHGHHSAGNFTTPSTASLFTGTYPWTHRALELEGIVARGRLPYNLFRYLPAQYHRAAFTQNIYADMLLYQFAEYLDSHFSLDRFAIVGHTLYDKLFKGDGVYGMKSFDQMLFKREEAHGSLFLSILRDLGTNLSYQWKAREYAEIYPYGLPRLANTEVYFALDEVIIGVAEMLRGLPQPFFAYIHLMPPHAPYVPRRAFLELFDDGWNPPPKKRHPLGAGVSEARLVELRREYDQFVADVDAEFGRLMADIERAGFFENSVIMVTSDHGELFERGVHGHSTPLMFEPVLHVPLLISVPGQSKRQDITTPTSNVDILPTVLHLCGQEAPPWCEGELLPGFSIQKPVERSLFSVEAKRNPAYAPLKKASLVLMRGKLKLIHYMGYKHYQNKFELYDLDADPGETENLYPHHPRAKELQEELEVKLTDADGA